MVPRPPDPHESVRHPVTPAPVRVLIVDDQPSFRRLARELLERRGYSVVGEAGSAAAAVDAAERLAPDAVLLDVRLGDGNGFEVSDALTRASPAPAVLLVSNNDYRDCHSLVKDSGARGFVLKSRLAATDLAEFWPTPAAYSDSPRALPAGPNATNSPRAA
jgi:DNA-binding NarL/FixJ family response regulator